MAVSNPSSFRPERTLVASSREDSSIPADERAVRILTNCSRSFLAVSCSSKRFASSFLFSSHCLESFCCCSLSTGTLDTIMPYSCLIRSKPFPYFCSKRSISAQFSATLAAVSSLSLDLWRTSLTKLRAASPSSPAFFRASATPAPSAISVGESFLSSMASATWCSSATVSVTSNSSAAAQIPFLFQNFSKLAISPLTTRAFSFVLLATPGSVQPPR